MSTTRSGKGGAGSGQPKKGILKKDFTRMSKKALLAELQGREGAPPKKKKKPKKERAVTFAEADDGEADDGDDEPDLG